MPEDAKVLDAEKFAAELKTRRDKEQSLMKNASKDLDKITQGNKEYQESKSKSKESDFRGE